MRIFQPTITNTINHTNAAAQHTTYTLATPLHVKRGDFISIQWTTPTWAGTGEPTAVITSATAIID